jgi:hypothetical protein
MFNHVSVEVFLAVKVKILDFWVVTVHSLMVTYFSFCFCFHPEDGGSRFL